MQAPNFYGYGAKTQKVRKGYVIQEVRPDVITYHVTVANKRAIGSVPRSRDLEGSKLECGYSDDHVRAVQAMLLAS
jgi:hypothetical protein